MLNADIRKSVKGARCLAMLMPLATMTTANSSTMLITKTVGSFVRMYLFFLFMRVLLSWFPAFDWDQQPWLALRQVTDPYLNIFKGLVPPLLGTIDFTPLLGFMILQWISGLLTVGDEEDLW